MLGAVDNISTIFVQYKKAYFIIKPPHLTPVAPLVEGPTKTTGLFFFSDSSGMKYQFLYLSMD